MDFGRITDHGLVDYTLPPNHPGVGKVLGGIKCLRPKVYVGGVLWANPGFVGPLYPRGTKPQDYARCYTQQFNTIELNATHYKIPDPSVLSSWKDAAHEGFKFCPKIHQNISHATDLTAITGLHNDYARRLAAFEEKLGTCFLQLPPTFSPSRLPELLGFLRKNALNHLAIEVRHPDWFRHQTAFNTLCNFLYQHQLPLVLTDTPGRRDVLHMRLTTKTLFIRFNANNHPSDETRISAWLARIKSLFDLGLENLYFFVHSPGQQNMASLVVYFTGALYRTCGIAVDPPVLNEAAG